MGSVRAGDWGWPSGSTDGSSVGGLAGCGVDGVGGVVGVVVGTADCDFGRGE